MKISMIAVLAMAFSTAAFAGQAGTTPLLSVKINSFTRVGGSVNSTLGEVCGTVTVTDTQSMPRIGNVIPVTVTADPNTGDPGNYTVLADRNGNFCTLINTYTGTASASAWLPGGAVNHTTLAHVAPAKRH